MTAGTGLTGTGGGAPAGIVVIAGSATLALNGCSTASHGIGSLEQLWREGEPVSDAPSAAAQAPDPAPTTQAKPTTPVATNAPKTGPAPTAQAKPTTPGVTNTSQGVHTIRNQHLAGKKHPVTGVPFDADGYPDFRAAGVVKHEVKIKMTGGPKDRLEANRVAGLTTEPKGFTWHHHQDGTTMQLVPKDIHEKTGHTGGAAIIRNRKP